MLPLISTDLHHYDISKCAYNILKNSGFDISSIEKDNKEKRNIQIGYIQKHNKTLSTYLLSETKKLIDIYLENNNIKKEDVFIVKDGIYLKEKLKNNKITLPIEYRYSILRFIFTLDRKSYLYITNEGQVVAKGIKDKPLDINFYDLFKSIEFSNLKITVKSIEKIRQSILHSKNIKWFSKPIKKDLFIIPIIDQGPIIIPKSSLHLINIEDVDKRFLWIDYVWPFCRSIILYMNEKNK